jgi:hypothetical protein
MNCAKWILAVVVASAPAVSAWAAAGDGLTPNVDNIPWARWQGRLSLGTQAPLWRSTLGGAEYFGLKVNGASLMGDYYFKRALADNGKAGGFRATSGVILGQRSLLLAGQPVTSAPGAAFSVDRRVFAAPPAPLSPDSTSESASVPYLGVGYSGLSNRGGWSLSADLGLVAMSPGNAIRLGRVFNGNQSLDDLLRDMRLAPVVQLGVSYSF